MRIRHGVVSLLASTEERLRVRVHQGCNRMEDADLLDLRLAAVGIRALNVLDRVTQFRQTHRRSTWPAGDDPLLVNTSATTRAHSGE